MTSSAIELKDVVFSYDYSKGYLLNGASISVPIGERVGIVGDNGTGKSTITKLLLGLIRPQKGSVCIMGKKVRWCDHYPRLGYIGDPGHNADELGLPLDTKVGEIQKIYNSIYKDKGEVSTDLGILRIDDISDRDVGNLSLGERKRLMIYMAMIKKPTILILDEASEGLDKYMKLSVMSMIKEYAEKSRSTMLCISHRIEDIAEYANKIYELSDRSLAENSHDVFSFQIEAGGRSVRMTNRHGGSILLRMDVLLRGQELPEGFSDHEASYKDFNAIVASLYSNPDHKVPVRIEIS